MKNARKGDGNNKRPRTHRSRQSKLPRKYRRYQEGLVSKFNYQDTLIFGCTDHRSDSLLPDCRDFDYDMDWAIYEDIVHGDLLYQEIDEARLKRLGYFRHHEEFGVRVNLPSSRQDSSEPSHFTPESIEQSDFEELIRFIQCDSSVFCLSESLQHRWSWQDAEILSRFVDGKPFNPYGVSDELLVHLAFSPLWKQSPSQLSDAVLRNRSLLLPALYGRFEAPKFLLWRHARGIEAARSLVVYVIMTKGYSIADILKLATDYKHYSKRITKCFWEIPEGTRPDEGIETAYLASMGIRLEVACEISRSGRCYDREVLDWFKKHSYHVQVNEVSFILNYMGHQLDENGRQGQSVNFRISPARMLREARGYEAAMQPRQRQREQRQRCLQRWEVRQTNNNTRRDLTPFPEDQLGYSLKDAGRQIEFVQLRTEKELAEEGQRLRHCVGSYGYYCSKGFCAIVSIRVDGVPRLTIEVQRSENEVSQVRGHRNRFPAEDEKLWIALWSDKKSLSYDF